jgi:hypothetical protein
MIVAYYSLRICPVLQSFLPVKISSINFVTMLFFYLSRYVFLAFSALSGTAGGFLPASAPLADLQKGEFIIILTFPAPAGSSGQSLFYFL